VAQTPPIGRNQQSRRGQLSSGHAERRRSDWVYDVPSAPEALLIEVVAAIPPGELGVSAFTQEEPGRPRDDWQAPWMEQGLDERGENVVSEPFDAPPDDVATSRLVFFLHYVALDRPLITPTGEVPLSSPVAMPPRLAAVEYAPVD
jgi:hypothetical protein